MSSSNLIIGLGNPGQKYHYTRHNIGFRIIDYFLRRYPELRAQHLCQAIVWQKEFHQKSVIIAKPLTFMNQSGLAVAQLANRFNVAPNQILIVYDDLNLTFGSLRFRRSGSAGGQNGMQSIIDHLRTKEFPRLRIGIGPSQTESFIDHVLGTFSLEETSQLDVLMDRATDAVESYLQHGASATMNVFNAKIAKS